MFERGGLELLPNPDTADPPLPPDTDFEVVFKEHGTGRTTVISGWTPERVRSLVLGEAF